MRVLRGGPRLCLLMKPSSVAPIVLPKTRASFRTPFGPSENTGVLPDALWRATFSPREKGDGRLYRRPLFRT
jgi:hypothetical protein